MIISFARLEIQFLKIGILRNKRFLRFFLGESWVLRRTACLGNDVYKKLDFNCKSSLNIQKGRIDLFVRQFAKYGDLLKAHQTMRLINRNDIKTLVLNQSMRYLSYPVAPRFILLDSYSELTDQEFVTKDSFKFYSNYSDISPEGLKALTSNGLFELNSLKSHYQELNSLIQKEWGGVTIIFLNFPEYLESRELFVNRARVIKDCAIAMSVEHENFHTVVMEEKEFWQLYKKSEDEFPYHYNDEIKQSFADKIDLILKDQLRDN